MEIQHVLSFVKECVIKGEIEERSFVRENVKKKKNCHKLFIVVNCDQ